MKKIIIITLLAIVTIPIKGYCFDLNPTGAVLEVLNTAGDRNSGISYLTNNNPGNNQVTVKDIEFYDTYQYNVPTRMNAWEIYGQGWPGASDSNIIEFYYGIRWGTGGTQPIYMEPKWVSTTGEEGVCQKVDEKVDQTNNGIYTTIVKAKCVTTSTLSRLRMYIGWNVGNNATIETHLLISKNIVFRPPTGDQEIMEILESESNWNIDPLNAMQDWIDHGFNIPNQYTNNYDSYETGEKAIYNMKDSYENLNNIQVNQDTNTYSLIWDIATRIKNSNVVFSTFMISCMSCMLIKIVLG